mgnify:FL=1
MRKFDMDAYTTRRMKELRGEKVYGESPDSDITRYTRRRMREIQESLEAERDLDKSVLGCYTVSTMGDHDGES